MNLGDIEELHHRIDRHEEHGREWITCLDCGAQWCIYQCVSVRGTEYEDGEEVSAGDGYCEEHASEDVPRS